MNCWNSNEQHIVLYKCLLEFWRAEFWCES